MKFQEFLSQNRIKLVVFGLGLVSFAAGAGVAFLRSPKISDYINNNTPKVIADQPVSGGAAAGHSVACTIKGKATKAGKKVYYYQGSLFYSKVKSPVCFDDEAGAQAAGYVRSAH